jgi:hypothetical protein
VRAERAPPCVRHGTHLSDHAGLLLPDAEEDVDKRAVEPLPRAQQDAQRMTAMILRVASVGSPRVPSERLTGISPEWMILAHIKNEASRLCLTLGGRRGHNKSQG